MKQKSLSFFTLISFALVSVALANIAHAGRYELIKGKGVEVCEAYGKNLNLSKSRLPMHCERAVSREMKDFHKPEWIRLDFSRSYGLLGKIDRFLWERDANPVYYFPITEWRQWRGTKEQYDRAWKSYKIDRDRRTIIGHMTSSVDIDNDGTPDNVYLDETCSSGAYGALLLVLNSDRTDLDYAKTKLVMPHPSRKEQGLGEFRTVKEGDFGIGPNDVKRGYMWVEDSLHDVFYDVFRYREKTYFDQWWRNHPNFQGKADFMVGKLHVFVIENHETQEICTYRYNNTD